MPKTQIYFGFFLVGFISALVIQSDTVTDLTDKHNLINWIR